MHIYGIDFTSAPRPGKPITFASAELENRHLSIQTVSVWPDPEFKAFREFLETPGPWVAGLDFPFGQPRQLAATLGIATLDWSNYVRYLTDLPPDGFKDLLRSHRCTPPCGKRRHQRKTDHRAGSTGARCLLDSGVNILPCCPRQDQRIAIEAYPKLVAKFILGRRPYKDGNVSQREDRSKARWEIIKNLQAARFREWYGFDVTLSDSEIAERTVIDWQGDLLDALLCAVQAAWAHSVLHDGSAPSLECDALEGWIADPAS